MKVNIVLMIVLLLTLGAAAQDDGVEGPDVIVTLEATGFAEGAGLAEVTGWAHVVSDLGHIHILLDANGAELPDGTVLEGWVVDAGLDGGPGESHVTDDDEIYGVPFGNADFDVAVEAAPYALSTGVLHANDDGTWEVIFDIPNYNFSAYDAVVITAESDGNTTEGFDPRPGTPVFAGAIAEGEPANKEVDASTVDRDMSDIESIEVILETTPLAANADLEGISGSALVYSDDATVEINVELNGAELPEGAVLEGWLVDAGLDGGPGETSVTDDDEIWGIPFGEADFDALVESAPYAFSTGVLAADDTDNLTLTFHVSGYNFSPYDAVVITLESDGNTTEGFDPRPGTPVLAGEIVSMSG